MFIYLVIIVSLSIFFIMSKFAKKSTFDSLNSDAIKQIKSASNFKNWKNFPSGMHDYSEGKAWMKDMGVLSIIPFQLIYKDIKSFYPVTLAANFANFISSLLIFYLSSKYWGENIAIIIYILYVFNFWSKMIMLHGGLQLIGEMCFLFSIFFIEQSFNNYIFPNSIYLILSGFFFIAMNFSSASSRKFIPLYIFSIIFYFLEFRVSFQHILDYRFIGIFLIIFFILTLFYTISKILFKPIKKKILYKFYLFLASILFLIFISTIVFNIENENIYKLSYLFIGSITGLLFFTLPNFKKNISGYLMYWKAESWNSHYDGYKHYFLKKYGKIFLSGKEGVIWYLKFYFRFVPFIFITYITAIIVAIYYFKSFPFLSLLLFISILPITWGEITKGPKALLPIYTTLLGLIIPIGYFLFLFLNFNNYVHLFIIIILLLCHITWNSYIFITDILPSRITVNKLIDQLSKYEITELYTFDTEYNYPFIPILNYMYPDKYKIIYIKSISEVNEGYVFIPCLNSKGAYFQSSYIGSKNDIAFEVILEESIKKSGIVKLQTAASSKYWQQLGNVVSFRDLILKELSAEDFNKGYAWLLKI